MKKKKDVKLKLREGWCWTGTLQVIDRRGGDYVVAFDAVSKSNGDRVYDHAQLTPAQLFDITGWKEDK